MPIAAFCLLGTAFVCAQQERVPIEQEGHHRLVIENDYARAFRVELPSGQSTLLHQHSLDYISIQIGTADIENAVLGKKAIETKLDDGNVRFTKGGFAHSLTNLSREPFVNVTVEVKKPSTKAFCGTSWPGQLEEACSPRAGLGGGVFAGGSQSRKLETDAVSADFVDSQSPYGISLPYASVLVALTPLTVSPFGRHSERTIAGEHKLQAGDVFFFAPHQWAGVTPEPGHTVKFVIVGFH